MKKNQNGDLSVRQNIILKTIVDEYIQNATPIASIKLQEIINLNISSATIRNESMYLEEIGFLEKSHSSSGKIPSTKGYRYYVDKLMEDTKINEVKEKIDFIFQKRENSIESVLSQASALISEMTNLATVVVTQDTNKDVFLSKIELIPFQENKAAMLIVLSNGMIENRIIDIENDISIEELTTSINIFNERLINTQINEIEIKIKLITPIIKEQVQRYEFILKTFMNTILGGQIVNYKTHGMKNLMQNPEFNDPNKIKAIISILEDTSLLSWFDKNNNSDKTFFKIGEETGLSNDIAVVGKNLTIKPGMHASLAAFGPKRIHYNLVSELMDWFSKRMEEEFFKNNTKYLKEKKEDDS